MNLSESWIRRPVMTTLVMGGILFFGALSYRKLPINNLPDVDFPTISVNAALPGASPETMASTIATPLEKQFSTIAGIESMTSASTLGATTINIQFSLNRKIDAAALDVNSAISAAMGVLPRNMPNPPTYQKVNPADMPIIFLALNSESLPVTALNDFSENVLIAHLSAVDGVAFVDAVPPQRYAVRVQSFVDRFRYQANKASQVQSRVKQLEKIVRIDVPPMRKQILFKFPDPPPCGQPTLRLEGVEHGYGGLSVFHGVGLAVEKGERIALVGPNGAGKSTLMRVLSGGEAPRAGTRTEGNGLKIAYFAQDQAKVLSPGKTVLEEILAAAPMAMVPRVRDILGAFLFTGDDAHKPVSVLSGGERNRLALAILLLRPANLLLLDEPTNHLDLKSKDVLLKSLERYTGTIVFVSHDRHFVDHLATRVLEIGGGDVVSWPGNYEAFLAGKARVGDAGHQELRVEHRDVVRPGTPPPPSEERKQSYAERKEAVKAGLKRERRLAEALARIEEVEARFKEVEASMSDPVLYQDAPRWKEASEKYAALQEQVAKAWVAWEAIEAEANA